MSEEKPVKLAREERLALKLRENLHRRKAQARAQQGQDDAALSKEPHNR
jgi:hypothetical protein